MLSEQAVTTVIERYTIGLESLANLSKEYHTNYFLLRNILVAKGIKIRNKTESLQKYVKYSICVVCGRQFRMRERWDSTTNHHNQTCGDSNCLHVLRSQKSKSKWTDERKEHMSELFTGRSTEGWDIARKERSPNWKGGKSPAAYRKIAFEERGLKKKCSICGSTDNVCVHHIDGNRSNNAPENHLIICKNQHTSNHDKLGDSGWAVSNMKIIPKIGIHELTNLLSTGRSMRSICKEYDTSHKTLTKMLKKYNVEIPNRKFMRKPKDTPGGSPEENTVMPQPIALSANV